MMAVKQLIYATKIIGKRRTTSILFMILYDLSNLYAQETNIENR